MGVRSKGKPIGPRGWFATLTPNILVIAHTAAARKFHLVRLRERGDVSDSRQGKPRSDGSRWDFSEVWNGRSLCGGGDSRVTYGNRSSYYWQPQPDPVASYVLSEEICKECQRTFRRDWPERALADAVHTKTVVEPTWEPPFGWRVVSPQPHPYDVPADRDPTTVTNKAGEVKGERRKEIARWVRGIRVVRVCEMLDEPGYFSVRIHRVNHEHGDQLVLGSDRASCMQKAHEVMALGGQRG